MLVESVVKPSKIFFQKNFFHSANLPDKKENIFFTFLGSDCLRTRYKRDCLTACINVV